MPQVKVAFDNIPEGQEVEVPYLGLFENGSTTEVDQDQWDRFVANAPGGERYEDQDTLEVGTEAAQRATEEHRTLREAALAETTGQPADQESESETEAKPLSDYKKDELVEMAKGRIEGASDMKKDELVEALSEEG